MESRVKEIDYLKCIFITLMIIFHLVLCGRGPKIVSTCPLLISAMLANSRRMPNFLRKFAMIWSDYACMEAPMVMSHFLPVRESVIPYSYRIYSTRYSSIRWTLQVSAYTDSVQPHLLYHIPMYGCRRCLRLVLTGVCLFALF